MPYRLKTDVVSSGKDGKIYGVAGQEVSVIDNVNYDHLCIVEIGGVRFFTRWDNVEKFEKQEKTPSDPVTVVETPKPVKNQKPTGKKSTKIIPGQSEMF